MKTVLKKLLVLLLCLSMAFNVYVSDVNASGPDMDDYALSVASDMLNINGYDASDNISISNKMCIFNLEDEQSNKYVYMVLDDEELIAMLIVELIDGEYYASLELGVPEEIAGAYEADVPFALCNYSGYLILCKEEENTIVSSEIGVEISEDSLDYSDVSLQSVSVTYEDVMSVSESVSSMGSIVDPQATYGAYTVSTLGVPYVANANSPASGKGICWAACVAAIANYRVGKSHTALSLHNQLWSYYTGMDAKNYPTGDETWIKRAFTYCGMSYTYIESGLRGSQISSALSNGRPIYMSVLNSDGGHAVVIKGIYVYGNGNNYYQIMDPNTSGTVTVTVSDNVLNDSSYFTCTLSTGTYSNWRYSYY